MSSDRIRNGTALVVALGVVMMAAILIVAATDSSSGSRKVAAVSLAEQEASYAAESVAAMVEGKMVDLSGDIENLSRDIVTWYNNPTENFWNLRGYCFADGESIPSAIATRLTAAGMAGSNGNLGLRFGNCVVRWRVEPVMVLGTRTGGAVDFASILNCADPNRGNLPFTVNYTPSPNDPAYVALAASHQWADCRDNGYFLHYRVVTEAYRLADPSSPEAAPWRSSAAGSSIASSQAQRVVQFKLLNLFRYVIFYAATGPTGDLDLYAGSNIGINGAVHTNASFYLGGQGLRYLDVNGYNYHDSASSLNTMTIGSAAKPVSVTAVDGIFRMRKDVNLYAALKGLTGASADPMQVPLSGAGAMTGTNDLNGNDANSGNVIINGQKFTNQVDSRRAQLSAYGTASMEARFNGFVKDGRLGARMVRTLANLPQLAGRPLEHQYLAPEGAPLYVVPAANLPPGISAIDFSGAVPVPDAVAWSDVRGYAQIIGNLSLNTGAGYRQLLYTDSSRTALTTTASPATIPVPATNLPLYWQDAGHTRQDISPVSADYPDAHVHPSQASGAQGYDGSGFRGNACDGYYCDLARRGQSNATTTGLTIREKPWQSAAVAKPFPVEWIELTGRGSGYTQAPAVTITGGGGYGATATTVLFSGPVMNFTVTNGGTGYSAPPAVTISGGGGSGATATATMRYRIPAGTYALGAQGAGYTSIPRVVITAGTLLSGTAPAISVVRAGNRIVSITVPANAAHYSAPPVITFTGGGGRGARFAFSGTGFVSSLNLVRAGSGYTSAPTVSFSPASATATATIDASSCAPGQIMGITVTNPGFGYTSPPTVTIAGPGGHGTAATATAYLVGGGLTGLTLASGGSDWTLPPMVKITGGGGGGAMATATVSGGAITGLSLVNAGYGYTSDPIVTFSRAEGDTTGSGGSAIATAQPAPIGPWPEARQRYVDYLNSNYDVFLGKDAAGSPIEISGPFFGQILDPARAPTAADYIVTEDDFVNLRESTYLAKFYYGSDPTGNPGHRLRNFGAPGCPYRTNVLTLNLREVQDFIKYRRWERDVLGDATSGDPAMAKTRFNGLIYVHRTRRSGTYDPILRPGLFFDPAQGKPVLNPTTGEVTGAMTTAYGTADALAFAGPGLPAASIDANPGSLVHPNLFREGSGPIETFHAGVRLAKADIIDWDHDADDDGTDEPTAILGRSGLTVITPNPMYLWGDFNRKILTSVDGTNEIWMDFDAATAGERANRLPPCAVFADGVVSLSPDWTDAAHQSYVGRGTPLTAGSTVNYNTSLVINNIPSQMINAAAEGSGAVPNVLRFLEGGTRTMNFRGSLVVLNQQRYSKGMLGCNASPQTYSTGFYGPPARNYTYNDDLLKSAGQPPFAPFGMQVTRVLSQIHRRN